MPNISRETRLQIMVDDDELEAIDMWRFHQHMPSRAAAIRSLLNVGLNAVIGGKADPSLRSQDFGLLNGKK